MRTKVMWVVLAVMLCAQTFAVADAKDAKSEKKSEKTQKTVAVFALGTVTETPKDEDFIFGEAPGESLKDLLARMNKVAEDEEVGACLLLVDKASFALAQVEEIRQAVDRIKASGKKVYAHADSLSMMNYALLSDASSVSVVPTGSVWVTGFYGESPYVRGLLDMIGVTPDFLTCGKFKSAAEVFMRKGPSPEAAQMRGWLLDSMYETYVKLVAEGRGVPVEKVKAWIDGGPYSAAKAKELGMIDGVMHRQALAAALKKEFGEDVKFDKKYGKKKKKDVDFSSPFAVFKIWGEILSGPKKKKPGKTAVAIVYVEGPIVCGSATPSLFGADEAAYSTPIRKALDKAAADDSIKAVVLRVNSPGGSATASEIILDATKRVKEKKPLIVSMGGVAGSGGVLRGLRVRHDLRRRLDDHRLHRRRRRQTGDGPHVGQGRHLLERHQTGRQRRHAQLLRRLLGRATQEDAGLDGRNLRHVQRPRHGHSGRPLEEEYRRTRRRPGLHRQAGTRTGPGRQDRRPGRRHRLLRQTGQNRRLRHPRRPPSQELHGDAFQGSLRRSR